MTLRGFECTWFHKGILDYSLECITLLQNDFFKQRYITFNVTIPGQDRIDPNTYLCRTFLLGIVFALYSECFAKFDDIPSVTLQDIKETKRYRHTFVCFFVRSDNMKTVYSPTNTVYGGYKTVCVRKSNLQTPKH